MHFVHSNGPISDCEMRLAPDCFSYLKVANVLCYVTFRFGFIISLFCFYYVRDVTLFYVTVYCVLLGHVTLFACDLIVLFVLF